MSETLSNLAIHRKCHDTRKGTRAAAGSSRPLDPGVESTSRSSTDGAVRLTNKQRFPCETGCYRLGNRAQFSHNNQTSRGLAQKNGGRCDPRAGRLRLGGVLNPITPSHRMESGQCPRRLPGKHLTAPTRFDHKAFNKRRATSLATPPSSVATWPNAYWYGTSRAASCRSTVARPRISRCVEVGEVVCSGGPDCSTPPTPVNPHPRRKGSAVDRHRQDLRFFISPRTEKAVRRGQRTALRIGERVKSPLTGTFRDTPPTSVVMTGHTATGSRAHRGLCGPPLPRMQTALRACAKSQPRDRAVPRGGPVIEPSMKKEAATTRLVRGLHRGGAEKPRKTQKTQKSQ